MSSSYIMLSSVPSPANLVFSLGSLPSAWRKTAIGFLLVGMLLHYYFGDYRDSSSWQDALSVIK